MTTEKYIHLSHVSTHNLKNISVSIPHGKITVITGVSGSGKSSLAIDTLYAEGQRRYIESLSPYTRQYLERMERPDVEHIEGILPAICIEAKNGITNARSTVGTQTEANDFLRILFARIGKMHCPVCREEIRVDYVDTIAHDLLRDHSEAPAVVLFSLPITQSSKSHVMLYVEELMKQGYRRIFVKGKLHDLEKTDAVYALLQGETHIEIVLDRIVLKEKNKSRLIDSLSNAYQRGHNRLRVAIFETRAFDTVCASHSFSAVFACNTCQREYPKPEPNMFSFNSPVGACPECEGFGRVIVIDPALIIPNDALSLDGGAIVPWEKPSAEWERTQMLEFCTRQKIPRDVPFKKLKKRDVKKLFSGVSGDDYVSINGFFAYLERKKYKMHVRILLSRYRNYVLCPLCHGARLKKESLAITIQEKSIHEVQKLTISELRAFLDACALSPYEKTLIGAAFGELHARVTYLDDVGLDYMTLDRMSRTLSGGEMQRINLATALGTQLVDTLYVLDEPSIGLHERDTHRLISLLRDFKALGNTVVVIEHDRKIMDVADYIIDLGPGAGVHGGTIMAAGTQREIIRVPESLTGAYLRGDVHVELFQKARAVNGEITMCGASEHNLQGITVSIPLGQFVVVTGVSGSGKSTLIYDTLYKQYQKTKGRAVSDIGVVQAVRGFDRIDDMVFVDQSSLGRSSRSCILTYGGVYSDVRALFAGTHDARIRGLTAKEFSFNVAGGRCEKCQGLGRIREEMHFLADVYLSCEHCRGKRFSPSVLEVFFKEKTIVDIFDMTVVEALAFYAEYPRIVKKLTVFKEVGLGYVTLGQPSTTLSAGEAQRMKLAVEMIERKKEHLLYIFDEPTVGLHYSDIAVLMKAFERLLNKGHSVVVIEHNIDVIKNADYLIDLGPGGGGRGGQVVFSGTPKECVRCTHSETGHFLKACFENN